MIRISHLTKRFGTMDAVKDLSLTVQRGEAVGVIGPNGAGKSTTIRCLLGFIRPSDGQLSVGGFDCWSESVPIHRQVGYVPGEVILPDNVTGRQFLRDMQLLRRIRNEGRLNELIGRFAFSLDLPIRQMSKGTRQKLALIAAFFHDPSVFILDEPTSGLDPVMQHVVLDLLREEHERGKTIFMSSHIFTEIERTCDKVAMIKAGQLIAWDDINRLRSQKNTVFEITLETVKDADKLAYESTLAILERQGTTVTVAVRGDYQALFKALATVSVLNFQQRTQDLETVFEHLYSKE